jgi:hypothetical protein
MAACITGCGQSNGLVPVSGRVAYKGQPAAGARLHFHRADATPTTREQPIPSALVDDQGHFELTTGDLGFGAPVGRYVVLVDWPEQGGTVRPGIPGRAGFEPGSKLNKTPADRLNGRYLDLSTPRITAEITADSRILPTFELTD